MDGVSGTGLRIVEASDLDPLLGACQEHLGTYRKLLQAIEEKTARIESRYPQAFACRSGCHDCCQEIPTILPVEWAWMRDHDRKPEAPLVSRLHPGERLCARLESDGRCAIYPFRPVVCRTQGHLLLAVDQEVDHCPWNFEGVEDVDAEEIFSLEDLHGTLLRVNLDFLRRAVPDRFAELAGCRVRFHP
ncbi:MAG: YkgJ family cysteine cluster protein [Fibrobacteria bacterium]|nr:YkgJ family cysteine cluster protein [Fibrobacteria bacterium]